MWYKLRVFIHFCAQNLLQPAQTPKTHYSAAGAADKARRRKNTVQHHPPHKTTRDRGAASPPTRTNKPLLHGARAGRGPKSGSCRRSLCAEPSARAQCAIK